MPGCSTARIRSIEPLNDTRTSATSGRAMTPPAPSTAAMRLTSSSGQTQTRVAKGSILFDMRPPMLSADTKSFHHPLRGLTGLHINGLLIDASRPPVSHHNFAVHDYRIDG